MEATPPVPTDPATAFSARGRDFVIDEPQVMGIVNASPESFSGDGFAATAEQADKAVAQFAAGAFIVDVGGQSANTKTPELDPDEEIRRLLPLIEAIRERHDGLLSVDTYKPPVAAACLEAGADVINDVSGLWYPELADVVADFDAGIVLMHTQGPPKVKILDPRLYDDVVADVIDFAAEKMAVLDAAGVRSANVMFDPGIDFAKTPRQSIELLARGEDLASIARPLLFALSRKDFIGAITETMPRDRDPGTLASVGIVADGYANSVVRVHEVAATRQFLDVWRVLRRPDLVGDDLHLRDDLRRTPTPS